MEFNPLNAKLNPICDLRALLGAHHILHVGRISVKHLLSVQPVILLSKDVLRLNTPADRSYVLWL
jgi:hypothetical protein